LALQTIRSLLEDGLVQMGDLPSPDGKFPAWDLTIDAAMEDSLDEHLHESVVPVEDEALGDQLTLGF
jgi:hypothetical protein